MFVFIKSGTKDNKKNCAELSGLAEVYAAIAPPPHADAPLSQPP